MTAMDILCVAYLAFWLGAEFGAIVLNRSAPNASPETSYAAIRDVRGEHEHV